jgi:NAD(P)-dependent dehydrogenase (short-subunit alcohol dehydrogenase family)
VTGASRGIGAALVQALLEHGASKVYAAARHEEDLAKLRAARNRRIVPVDLDVTKSRSSQSRRRPRQGCEDPLQQRRRSRLRQRP